MTPLGEPPAPEGGDCLTEDSAPESKNVEDSTNTNSLPPLPSPLALIPFPGIYFPKANLFVSPATKTTSHTQSCTQDGTQAGNFVLTLMVLTFTCPMLNWKSDSGQGFKAA